MRYDVRTWLGTGATAEPDKWWRVWGRRRAQNLAQGAIRDYEDDGVSEFDVCIFETRTDAIIWFYSTDRERRGLPPLEDRIEGP